MKLKPFKIRTLNESHSREIQEWLFSLGYSWNCGSRDVKELKETCLFLDKGILKDDLTLSYGFEEVFFETKNLPEAWFYDGKIHYEPKPQPLPEFKIKIESPEHSRKLQEFVFSMGCRWWYSTNEPKQEFDSLDAKYLYLEKTGGEGKPALSTTTSGYFDKLKLPEMWFYNGKLRNEPPQLEPQTQPQLKTYRQLAEALLEGTKLQFFDPSGDWIPINYLGLHMHQLDREYPYEVRVKPRVCNGVELDPCLTEHPDDDYYYYPDPMHVDYYYMKLWTGDEDDIRWFELGFAYDSSESAAKHGKAMGITNDY